MHLGEGLLDVELLVGTLSNLLAELNVSEHVGFDDTSKGEAFLGADVEANLVGDLVPMAVLHTVLPESDSQRNVGLEVIDGFFHRLSDLGDLGELLVLEEAEHTGHDFVAVLESGIEIVSIKLLPRVIEP